MLDGGVVLQRLHLIAHVLLGKFHVFSGEHVRRAIENHRAYRGSVAALQIFISMLDWRLSVQASFIFIFLNLKTFCFVVRAIKIRLANGNSVRLLFHLHLPDSSTHPWIILIGKRGSLLLLNDLGLTLKLDSLSLHLM